MVLQFKFISTKPGSDAIFPFRALRARKSYQLTYKRHLYFICDVFFTALPGQSHKKATNKLTINILTINAKNRKTSDRAGYDRKKRTCYFTQITDR